MIPSRPPRRSTAFRLLLPSVLTASLVVLAAITLRTQAPAADLVVLNGKIVTLDAQSRVAEALAIRDGVFVAVGSGDEIRPHIGEGTRVVDAGGRMVIPGLIDSHVHALGVAAEEARQPFVDLRSIAEMQAWIRRRAAELPEGTWIWSPRVFPTRVRERRFPTREELDAAAPAHPVVIDGAYALMVNTAALEAAGITADTPDPPGGAIVRDARGNPTGLLRNVGNLLSRFRPAGGRMPLEKLEEVHRHYLRTGITSIVERLSDVGGYRAYRALQEQSRLGVRATVTLNVASDGTAADTEGFIRSLPVRFGEGDDWLKVGPLKVIADGGILAGTAYMREPYGERAAQLYGVADPGYRGFLTRTPEALHAIVRTAHRLGWQMAVHVTGDAGVDTVLDAFEAANRDASIADRRFTLIHAYFANPQTAARAARLGVLVDTQPAWYYKDADALVDALGEARLEPFIGLDTWLDAGATVALNTDHMFGLDANSAMNPYNPFLTMYVAVTRRTEGGRVIGAGQAVPRERALRMMTTEAARFSFDESKKGSIEVGKLGDFVVLSDDYFAVPDERIRHITAVLTVVGGRVAWDADQARSQPSR
ncbi:MAG TPA: amidohydrolase [Vicinamibacterales bacterium]